MQDEFKTIKSEARAETKVHGSRFIATALPVSTKAEAEQFLAGIRKEFWDATHNCFAYRVGTDGMQFRFGDDGEPSGSAGKPILATIDKFELTDIIVVVTRYFGGTKLGVGGLVRAYGDAAEQALSKAEKLTKYKTEIIEATFPHSHISNVMHVVSKIGAKIVDTMYDEDVHAKLEIRLSNVEELKSLLVNQTNGNINLKPDGH
ncbi:MAG: YigZ family protein [Bacteroidota bacterium]